MDQDWLKNARESFEETLEIQEGKLSTKTYATINRSKDICRDDFRSIATISEGTFGTTELVRNVKSNELLVMKCWSKQKIVQLNRTQHVSDLLKILSAVKHPFLLPMKYHCQDSTSLYMLQEYIPGVDMLTHLRRMGRLNETVVRFYAAQVVLTFEYLHHLDLVYRNLKPENLLIDLSGYIKFTDFSCMKRVTGRTWTLCGTVEYLAPEVILSRGHGKPVDWWALGIILFEMTTGVPPFYDDEPGVSSDASRYHVISMEKILRRRLTYRHYHTKEFKWLLHRLLQFDIDKRYGILKNGINDIKLHEWFDGTDWTAIFEKKAQPPYVPKCSGVRVDPNVLPTEYVCIDIAAEKAAAKAEFDDFYD